MRAISVGIAGGAALGEFLEPGNYVDMLVTLMPQNEEQNRESSVETHMMLQSVHVLAVGDIHGGMSSNDRNREGQSASVTLSVTPAQAEKISYAMSVGQITLSLRNDMDDETIEDSKGVGVDDILPPEKKQPPLKIIKRVTPKAKPTGPSICNGPDCRSVGSRY
jgi:pilus assembly protein CpaB